MPRVNLKKMLPGLKTMDMFGYAPELNFRGSTAVTTYLGTFVSIIMYGLMILNVIQLSVSFNNGSRQNKSFTQEFIDRSTYEPQYFKDNKFEIAVLPFRHIEES